MMRKRKLAALAALVGTVAAWGGCLGWTQNTWWGRVVWDGVLDTAWEFVFDNDGTPVLDLFGDDAPGVIQ